MAILRDETPHVQQVSIDEAFMDVTPTAREHRAPGSVAQRIQERVTALGVTLLHRRGHFQVQAKIATATEPRGLTVVFPGTEAAFLEKLPVRTLSGVAASREDAPFPRRAHLGSHGPGRRRPSAEDLRARTGR
ncbi:MAG: hypothetical protein ACLTDR_00785 [Adlercreutzia equolifaciens]